jgi:hypothetical protein
MTAARELRDRLDAAQESLTRALAGITEEQFKRRPPATPEDPTPWSIAELLAHLLTIERTWYERVAQGLVDDGSEITPSPPEAHEEGAKIGRSVPVPTLIHGLLGARRVTLNLLGRATAEDGRLVQRTLWHPRLQQRLDLQWMFEKIAGHHEEHQQQIATLRQAVGAPPVAEAKAG